MNTLLRDLRYALRMLRQDPGFAVVAVLTLALGIGATTAVFSIVNSALLHPLAYRDPQQLYLVREIVPQLAKFYPTVSANLSDFHIWQKRVNAFEDVAIAESTSADLTGQGQPQVLRGVRASANIFSVLGIQPALGRGFRPEEDETGRGHVLILTDASGTADSGAIPPQSGKRSHSTVSPTKSWVSSPRRFRLLRSSAVRKLRSLSFFQTSERPGGLRTGPHWRIRFRCRGTPQIRHNSGAGACGAQCRPITDRQAGK